MPPKIRRPAAAKGKAKAAARHRVRAPRGVLRRPGAAGADFQGGAEVEASQVKLEEWSPGLQILVTEGYYFGQKISLSGEVRSMRIGGGSTELMLLPLGSPDEDLVKWTTANPGTELQTHVCPVDCTHIPDGEGVLHAQKVQILGDVKPPWALNLRDAVDELALLRARQREADEKKQKEDADAEEKAKKRRKEAEGKGGKEKKKKKKDKEEKTRKRKAESLVDQRRKDTSRLEESVSSQSSGQSRGRSKSTKVVGQKPLRDLFSQTGLDPDLAVRRRIQRKVRKKKSSSSSSSETATDSSCLSQEGLFEEDAKVKKVASRGPGLLASTAVANMQGSLLTRQGDLLEAEAGPVPAIVLNYYRQHLQNRMSGGLSREALTLAFIADQLLRGHAAAAMDTALQRLKALDLIAGQLPWNIAQRVELAPREGVALASKMEAVEAARENKAEMQAYSGRFGDGIQGRQGRFESSSRQGPPAKGKGKNKKGKEKDGGKDAAKGEKKKE